MVAPCIYDACGFGTPHSPRPRLAGGAGGRRVRRGDDHGGTACAEGVHVAARSDCDAFVLRSTPSCAGRTLCHGLLGLLTVQRWDCVPIQVWTMI